MSLTLDCQVTRAELSLGTLYLQDPANGYQVVEVGPGAMSWRRETVVSPYVHGNTLVGAVKDQLTIPITVQIKGSSASQLDTRLDVVLDAFSQFFYGVGVVIDGVTKAWLCQPADWSVGEGGKFNKHHLMSKMYEVTLNVPRHPVPFAGSM